MSAFCICKDQNLGPGTGAYLVRFQGQPRVGTVHSSCNQDSWGNPAMLLVWDSQSQIQRNDRVRLAASQEVKARLSGEPRLGRYVQDLTAPVRQCLQRLEQGAADISGSGIMNSIISADGGADTVPAHFAEINARDGFFILSRRNDAHFQWEMLRGPRLSQ